MTINEAAELLRVTKRTIYRLRDLPRVRIGHRWMFIEEDLEAWVRSRRQEACAVKEPIEGVDQARSTGYHRNPLFVLPRSAGR
jgi:excisionase family DNA binding protein